MKASLFVFLSTACAFTFLAAEAKSITLPDTSSCNSTGPCLTITNSNGGSGARAFHGEGTWGVYGLGRGTNNIGVIGASGDAITGTGVYGYSQNYFAVHGYSENGNGVVAQNTRTDWVAAAISAIPGNSNGLAIWAGGGAQKPGGGSWSSTSDARVKKDVKDFRAGLAELKRLRPVSYKYNGLGGTQDDGNVFVGVIAQELEKVLPSMVESSKVRLRPGDREATDLKRVDPSAFTYVLINAVQEQQKIIERQEARIAKLERSDAPSGMPTSLAGLALGLMPLGLIAVWRRRKEGGQL